MQSATLTAPPTAESAPAGLFSDLPAARPAAPDPLNPPQREAAAHGARDAQGRFRAGPLLVIAGAGTGKTATLAHRVAHLVLQGVDPERILLLTFSRRAAQEMVRRAEAIVGAEMAARGRRGAWRLPWAGTFHAIGARLLRQHAGQVGLDPSFGILDRGDAADLIDMLRHELDLSAKPQRFPRKDTCLAIYSHRVNTGWPLERVLEEAFPWCAQWADELRGLFRAYVERKQSHGVLDYDDLLLWWHAAVSEPSLAAEIGARFDHVLVDEYQDTNALQAQILFALKPDGDGLTVVGDDAQSIYSFRAADIGNILGFPDRFSPPARRITLELNYRSVQPVLDAANALLAQAARQYPKTLRATRGAGAMPRLVSVLDDRAQAEHVAGEVLRQREAGVALKRQAVLFRSSHHSDLLELELTRRNIPFVKHGGLKFLEAAHVKDLLALLRWADNPRHGIAAFRALQLMNGFGPVNAQRCREHVASAGHRLHALAGFPAPPAAGDEWPAFVALMTRLTDPSTPWPGQVDLARRWYQPVLERRHDDAVVRAADLDMLAAVAPQFGDRERFLTELTLDPPQASGDLAGAPLLDEDYLVLSTVHSAKGQEWDAVYVLNVADGNFPNEYATGNAETIEEERRLLYVALTRARDTLQLIEPQRYYVTGQARFGDGYVHGARSRFLSGPVLACLERAGPPAQPGAPKARTGQAQVDVAARLRGMW
ncbi:MAG TPA: ATP-dependent helicase [Quisquiliibacterium sp.]|nr:ATP-dependent helicase [Quisquiliibacterium sp.]